MTTDVFRGPCLPIGFNFILLMSIGMNEGNQCSTERGFENIMYRLFQKKNYFNEESKQREATIYDKHTTCLNKRYVIFSCDTNGECLMVVNGCRVDQGSNLVAAVSQPEPCCSVHII